MPRRRERKVNAIVRCAPGYVSRVRESAPTIRVGSALVLERAKDAECTWRCEAVLGKGNFASVYLLRQIQKDVEEAAGLMERRVLKVLGAPNVWEMHVSSKLKSLLPPQARSSFTSFDSLVALKDGAWLVSKYKGQASLQQAINAYRKANKKMEEAVVMFYAIELMRAVEALHKTGLLHGDIKPDNILIAAPDHLLSEPHAGGSLSMRLGIPEPDHESWSDLRTHTVKVLDFGLAKILDIGQGRVKALTKAGYAPGTAHYMSPEQARGTGDLDYRADLYAVGLLLYRMLTGEEAFPGDNAMEVIGLQLSAPTPNLPATQADDLNQVVQRATAKSPADRFSSADEMAWAIKCAHNPILREGPAPAIATPPPLSKPSMLRRIFGR